MTGRLIFLAAGAVAVTVARRVLRTRHGDQGHFAPIVSINREAAEVREESGLEAVDICEERGGTVVRATAGEGPSWRKLRETRQLLETGEVLHVEGQPHGTRKPLGTLLERAGQAVKERAR